MWKHAPVVTFVGLLIVQGAFCDAASVTSAATGFGQDVYTTAAASYDNLVFSPYSLHSILTLASRAARGETLQQMNTVLGLSDMSSDAVETAYANLISSVADSTDVNILTANRIFMNPNVNVDSNFTEMASGDFSTMVENLNFSDPSGPASAINDFVQQNGNFANIFNSDALSVNDTQVILVNGLTFTGNWTMPFNPQNTTEADFYLNSTETVKVDMMMQQGSFDMKFNAKYTTLKLPYAGDRFSLYIVVLNSSAAVENPQCLPTNNLDDYFFQLTTVNATIYVPKFEIRFQSDMVSVLQSLGMHDAFNQSELFSNVSTSNVPHVAAIKVAEYGTGSTGSATGQPSSAPDQDFHVNRPFLFFLRDDTNNATLLQGKFFQPQTTPTDPVSVVTRTPPSCEDDAPVPGSTTPAPGGGGDGATTLTLAVTGWLVSLMSSFFALRQALY